MRKTFVFDPEKKKMVPKEEYVAQNQRHHMVIPPLEEFQSPITGEIIRNREQLRAHNRQHGVTNIADYSNEWYQKKAVERKRIATGQTPEAKAERIAALKKAIYDRR
jgi:hypothetical protein